MCLCPATCLCARGPAGGASLARQPPAPSRCRATGATPPSWSSGVPNYWAKLNKGWLVLALTVGNALPCPAAAAGLSARAARCLLLSLSARAGRAGGCAVALLQGGRGSSSLSWLALLACTAARPRQARARWPLGLARQPPLVLPCLEWSWRE